MGKNDLIRIIIDDFARGLEPMKIAKSHGFVNHRYLAKYLHDNGYVWSTELKNYIKLGDIGESKCDVEKLVDKLDVEPGAVDFTKYVPVFDLLLENRRKIAEFLNSDANYIKIDSDLYADLVELCERAGVSPELLVNEVLREFIAEQMLHV